MRRFRWLLASCYGLLVLGTAVLPLVGGPQSYAPFSVLPAREPLPINVAVAPDLVAWLTPAARSFNATTPLVNGRPVQVKLIALPSDDLNNQLAGASAVIPASRVWVDRQKQRNPSLQFEASTSVARSPLVFLTWKDRAEFLFPKQTLDWPRLHTALADASADGWQKLGGNRNWGTVKIGFPAANSSHSGLGTLLLLMTAYKPGQNLPLPEFQSQELRTWLAQFEGGINGAVQASPANLTQLMASPAIFDAIPVSEYVAFNSGLSKRSNMTIIYPQPTVWADFPFTVLTTNPDERAAALLMRDFLLSDQQQQAALSVGLRPASTSGVKVDAARADNPFTVADNGLNPAEPAASPLPPLDVITSLLTVWERVRR